MSNGICHICWGEKEVAYCETCGHWFCEKCRTKWTQRMFEAVKNFINPEGKCCGPIKN